MGRSWIEEDKACDILFSADPTIARDALEGMISGADLVVQGEAGGRKRPLVPDMDSPLLTVVCLHELGDYEGRTAEGAGGTARGGRGETGFIASLGDRGGAEQGAVGDEGGMRG